MSTLVHHSPSFSTGEEGPTRKEPQFTVVLGADTVHQAFVPAVKAEAQHLLIP